MLLLRLLSRVRKKRRSVEPASLEISVAAAPEPTISSLKWLKKTVSIKSFNILVALNPLPEFMAGAPIPTS
jgi:hypothetical protein